MISNRRKRNGLFKLILVLLAVGFIYVSMPSQAATRVPHFALPAANNKKTIDINAYQQKVVLLNFFATWCPPCRKEIGSLIELQNKFGNKKFSIIGISMDTGSTRSRIVSKFIEKAGINYPVALSDEKVARDFGGVVGIPQSFLVDQAGNVVKSYPGYVDHQIFEHDIRSLLK